jgi:hypothetical protein
MNIFKGAKMSLSKFNIWREGMGNDPVENAATVLTPEEQQELNKAKEDPAIAKFSAAAKTVLNNLNTRLTSFTKNPKVMESFLSEIIKSVMDAANISKVSGATLKGVNKTLRGQN